MRLLCLLAVCFGSCQALGGEAELDRAAGIRSSGALSSMARGATSRPELPERRPDLRGRRTPVEGALVFRLGAPGSVAPQVLAPFDLELAGTDTSADLEVRRLVADALELEPLPGLRAPGARGSDPDLSLSDCQLLGGISVARDRADFRASLIGGLRYVLIDAEREDGVEVAGEVELVGPVVGVRLQF